MSSDFCMFYVVSILGVVSYTFCWLFVDYTHVYTIQEDQYDILQRGPKSPDPLMPTDQNYSQLVRDRKAQHSMSHTWLHLAHYTFCSSHTLVHKYSTCFLKWHSFSELFSLHCIWSTAFAAKWKLLFMKQMVSLVPRLSPREQIKTAFPFCKWWEAGQGLATRLANVYFQSDGRLLPKMWNITVSFIYACTSPLIKRKASGTLLWFAGALLMHSRAARVLTSPFPMGAMSFGGSIVTTL